MEKQIGRTEIEDYTNKTSLQKEDFCFSYNIFEAKLEKRVKKGDYLGLLQKIIQHPCRYVGIFRVTNFKTKLLQNITQSIEVKFGDFMEEIITEYISFMGYINIGKDFSYYNKKLCIDQIFKNDDGEIYIIEQKMRDDHDSTKKKSQVTNFIKKYRAVKQKYPKNEITSIMWFVDPTFTKNKNEYEKEIQDLSKKHNTDNFYLFYGIQIFQEIFDRTELWYELLSHMEEYRQITINDDLEIPNYDTSVEGYEALKGLTKGEIKKLFSYDVEYAKIRKELFPKKENLRKLKSYYKEIGDNEKWKLIEL